MHFQACLRRLPFLQAESPYAQVPWPVSTKTPAPTGRNTEVHDRDQTLEEPLFSGPAGMTNPIALHSSPFARGLDPSWWGQGIALLCPSVTCMPPKECSRVRWFWVTTAVTDRWETSSSHDYRRRIDSAKTLLQLSWKHLFYLIAPPGIPKPSMTSPTLNIQQDFTSPPLPLMFRLPSPFKVQVPPEKLQSVGILCEMAPGGHG